MSSLTNNNSKFADSYLADLKARYAKEIITLAQIDDETHQSSRSGTPSANESKTASLHSLTVDLATLQVAVTDMRSWDAGSSEIIKIHPIKERSDFKPDRNTEVKDFMKKCKSTATQLELRDVVDALDNLFIDLELTQQLGLKNTYLVSQILDALSSSAENYQHTLQIHAHRHANEAVKQAVKAMNADGD